MAFHSKSSRYLKPLVLVLSALVVGQILWWMYLLVSQAKLLSMQSGKIHILDLSKFETMILAEGAFFLCMLFGGLGLVLRTFIQEARLRKSQIDFLSAVSHELKTPLSTIQLCLDSLKRHPLPEDSKKRYVEKAEQSVQRLHEEIENILLYSQTQPIQMGSERIELKHFVRELLTKSPHDLTEEKIKMDTSWEEPLFVWGPIKESRLILQNILDNALKYGFKNASKPVRVSLSRSENRGVIHIRDEGIGFSSEEFKHLYEPFWRSDEAVKKAEPGTGLGLALAKRLSERAGVRLEVSSRGRGLGTQVSISWPCV